jgi:hypothetical protein
LVAGNVKGTSGCSDRSCLRRPDAQRCMSDSPGRCHEVSQKPSANVRDAEAAGSNPAFQDLLKAPAQGHNPSEYPDGVCTLMERKRGKPKPFP